MNGTCVSELYGFDINVPFDFWLNKYFQGLFTTVIFLANILAKISPNLTK